MPRKAVIDIGANSVKLLVADVVGHAVDPVYESGIQTRLGQGLKSSGLLQPGPIDKTLNCIRRYLDLAQKHGSERIHIIATSAVRESGNPADLMDAIPVATHSKVSISILSGEQEARLAFEGVLSTPGLDLMAPCLVVDLGGGSTELILGREGKPVRTGSYPIGTVRYYDMFAWNDPPSPVDWEIFKDRSTSAISEVGLPEFLPELEQGEGSQLKLIGTGGTLLILARLFLQTESFDRKRLEGLSLRKTDLKGMRKHLWSLSLHNRRKLAGLPAERADIILAGVGIVECLLNSLDRDSIMVSTRGLRFGCLLQDEQ